MQPLSLTKSTGKSAEKTINRGVPRQTPIAKSSSTPLETFKGLILRQEAHYWSARNGIWSFLSWLKRIISRFYAKEYSLQCLTNRKPIFSFTTAEDASARITTTASTGHHDLEASTTKTLEILWPEFRPSTLTRSRPNMRTGRDNMWRLDQMDVPATTKSDEATSRSHSPSSP